MGLLGLNLDLPSQLTFYGAYHNNPINKAIHFVFVPTILWTVLVGLAHAGALVPQPAALAPLGPSAQINLSLLVAGLYSTFYILLDLPAGLTWALCVGLPGWLTATAFAANIAGAWKIALGIHVFAWYMQIHPGHAVFEKRKPALLDSLVQAFALAPLFVWFELLFALGYSRKLHGDVQARVRKEIAKLGKSK